MTIYLAGPLFTLAERLFNSKLAVLLGGKGYEIWLPQANEPRPFSTAAIFTMDLNGLDHADAVLACMDGPDPDSGTAWECGYAYARGKMVMTYRTDFRTVAEDGRCEYNIMLWEGSDHRVRHSCIVQGQGTIQSLADALDRAIRETNHASLTKLTPSPSKNQG